jgi:hypothetical protein
MVLILLTQGEIMKRILTFVALLTIMAALATAQEAGRAKPEAKQPVKLFASSPQSQEMKKMTDTFAGLWKTTIHVFKGQWFPADGTAKGRAGIHSGPAGNAIVEQFDSLGPLGSFAGHGVYWYDKQLGAYQGLWCDSMDPTGCGPVGKGGWEGDNLVFNNQINSQGNNWHVRETFSNITEDSYDFMIEAAIDDAPMMKMMTIHYERAIPKSAATGSKK